MAARRALHDDNGDNPISGKQRQPEPLNTRDTYCLLMLNIAGVSIRIAFVRARHAAAWLV